MLNGSGIPAAFLAAQQASRTPLRCVVPLIELLRKSTHIVLITEFVLVSPDSLVLTNSLGEISDPRLMCATMIRVNELT